MSDFDEVYDRARHQPAFSNGFEGDCWMDQWCYRCSREESCNLLSVAMIGRTPIEWIEGVRDSLPGRYLCTSFDAIEGGTS